MDIKHVFNRVRPRSSDPQSIRERANQSMQDTAKRLRVIEVIVLTVSVIVFHMLKGYLQWLKPCNYYSITLVITTDSPLLVQIKPSTQLLLGILKFYGINICCRIFSEK